MQETSLRKKIYIIIFGTSTPAGKRFDVFLLWTILLSVLVVILESVKWFHNDYYHLLFTLEWIFTIIFTIEYFIRIYVSPKPLKYIFSTWGLIDFLTFIPSYLSLFISGYHYLLIVRIFRLLRVFRIFKLTKYMRAAKTLRQVLKASFQKILVFILFILSIVVVMGTLMYVIEGDKNGFDSIPQSIYWAIVTITTVGYGDITPHTVLGKIISSISMLIGYAIIAVPTGIITVEMSKAAKQAALVCPQCNKENTEDANFCNQCGAKVKREMEK